MTRVRMISVLAVVACVVLWGGAAAATQAPLTATGDAPADTAATSAVQEANASVTFEDQSANDTTVTVANVTLPEGGYVTIHDSSLLDGDALGSVVGVSEYLEPGTHENVTVTLYQDVPGADFNNTSVPNGTETLIAMPHMETSGAAMDDAAGNATDAPADDNATDAPADDNATETPAGDGATDAPATNQTYDFVATNGSEDGPYVANGEPVVDDAEVTFGGDAPTDGEEPEQPARGFVVENLSAPATAAPGDNLTVNATITNTGEEVRTDTVDFRLEGEELDLVFHREATIDAGVSTTISFELDTSLLTEGEYIHGVTTENSSSFAVLNVTSGEAPSEDGPAGNDTDTGDGAPGNDTAGNDTDDGAPDGQAQVTFTDQESDGFNVTVDSVTLPDGGYVTVHDTTLQDGDVLGSVIGVSDYLEPGTHENVTFTMFIVPDGNYDRIQLEGTETLIAMPHNETTGDEFYHFLSSNGTDDGPYQVGGEPVTATANVTVADGDTTTEGPGNESE